VKSRNPDAPVETIEVPDASTVVLKMAFPYAGITDLLSNYQNFYVMPRDETFNFKTDMRGSGPYFLESFRPSSGAVYKKNPDWYDKPRPYFDVLDRKLISDYAQGLAQLRPRTSELEILRQEDVLQQSANPGMLMLAEKDVEANARFTNFQARRLDFKDVRLRRALSYDARPRPGG
jgi:peptide/nickel transport system substrate-binding protein